MDKTWIVVAERSKARIFQYQGVGKDFLALESLEHPAGRLKNSEIDSDAPGKSFSSFGKGSHDMNREHGASEQEDQRFAIEIARYLDQNRQNKKIERLFIAADAGFLGMINNALNKETAALVSQTLSKDLGKVPDHEITARFSKLLPV